MTAVIAIAMIGEMTIMIGMTMIGIRYDQRNSRNDRRNSNRGSCNNRRNNHNRRRDPPQYDPRNSNVRQTNTPTQEAGNQSHPPPKTDRADTSNSAAVTCFKCNQLGHYATQCPTTDRGKAPTVNSIMADVQNVTTRCREDFRPQAETRATRAEEQCATLHTYMMYL